MYFVFVVPLTGLFFLSSNDIHVDGVAWLADDLEISASMQDDVVTDLIDCVIDGVV